MRSKRALNEEREMIAEATSVHQKEFDELAPVDDPRIAMLEIQKMTPETDVIVKGRFRNIERPGEELGLFEVTLYPGMKPFYGTFEHDKVYEIPLSIAKHINKCCAYPKPRFIFDATGKKAPSVTQWKSKYEFIPVTNEW